MTRFNVSHYFMWIIIGAIPMAMFYLATDNSNIVIKGIIGFAILEFILLFVAPRVEMVPIGKLYWEEERK